jgi:hypothetical protein
MGYDGQVEMEIEEFGGLNTQLDPTNLPIYMSPLCYNVEYVPHTVRSRYGFTTVLEAGLLATSVNYIKSYVMETGDIRTLFNDDLGNFWYEDATSDPGNSHLVTGTLPNMFPNSLTQFGREFIAFGDGQKGVDLPRVYDGTNFDRLSQDGPGFSSAVNDEVSSINVTALAMMGTLSIQSYTETGDICTVITSGAGSFLGGLPGDTVRIAGVGAGYNGDFVLLTIAKYTPVSTTVTMTFQNPTTGLAPVGIGGTVAFQLALVTLADHHNLPVNYGDPFNPAPEVTISGAPVGGYNGTWEVRNTPGTHQMVVAIASFGLAASGAPAVVSMAGDIIAGKHLVSVMFETRNGYITRPAVYGFWNAAGNKRAVVTNIPIGPANVVRRILIFTPVSSGDFFYIPLEAGTAAVPATVIDDNATTSTIVNFSDEDLLNGTPASDFFDLIVLPPVNGLIEYSSRLFAFGALNMVQGFSNLSFDGGFDNSFPAVPFGWTPDSTTSGGGSSTTDAVFGFAYKITGDGVSPVLGTFTQSAWQDINGVPILTSGTAYTISARFKKIGLGVGATVTVRLVSAVAGYSEGLTVQIASEVNQTDFVRLTADCAALPFPVPYDLVLQFEAQNLPNGESIIIDEIGLQPTASPVLQSAVLVSYAEDFESFNGITGLLVPSEENGQRLTTGEVIRDFLYLSKERSLFITQDNGSEPAGDSPWSLNEVSQRVGTYSFRGIGTGDEWATIAAESGFWYFTGGIITDDAKLSQEIQPTWDRINWAYGWSIDVKIDTTRKRIYVLVPLDDSTVNSHLLMLDYTEGFGDATNNNGVGRKWTVWNLHGNSHNMVVRPNGSLDYYLGGNAGSRAIKKYDTTTRNDDGAAIDNLWQSGYFQGQGRLNFGYLRANVQGAGTLSLTLKKGGQSWISQIRGWSMNLLGFTDMERQIQKQGYRMSVSFGTNAADAYWDMQGLSVYATTAIYAPVRGANQT